MIEALCHKLAKPLYDLPAERLDGLTELFALWGQLGVEAYKKTRPNAWIGEFFPAEICEIFDLNPIHAEGLICLLVMEGVGNDLIDRSVEMTLSRDPCPFQLGTLAGIFDHVLPDPDILLRANHSCIGREKQFQSASMLNNKPYLYIDLPNNLIETTEDYVARQIEEMFYKLKDYFGPKDTPEKIEEVFYYSNQIRENCIKINELRKACTLPIDSRTIFFLIPVLNGYIGPSKRLSDLSARIYQELSEMSQAQDSPEEGIIKLFLMVATFLFPDDRNFSNWLEKEMGVRFAFEEQSYVYWEPLDPKDPYRSLARKCLAQPWVGPLTRRLAIVDQLLSDYQAKGVYFTSNWGCRHLIGGVQVFRQHFAQLGIPFLNLEIDLGDDRNVDFSMVYSRVEEFLDVLKAKL
jgi:benzoyl-CoA reductase/2-hydroxyglutaryl-CoA dehydratase subunit BcrC/BadD/HgdB